MSTLRAFTPGLVSYDRAVAWQQRLVGRRREGDIEDCLVLLEHPPTVTMSRRSTPGDLLASDDWLERQGIGIAPTTRGGLATLHNPGQLVGYLVFDLAERGRDLHAFLRRIESSLIEVARDAGIDAGRIEGKTGVWVENRKLASIGIAVRRWVSWHGFALNVRNDLTQFDAIVPCGLSGVRMTSLSAECGRQVAWDATIERTIDAVRSEFGFRRVVRDPTGPETE